MNRYKFTPGNWSASPSQSFYVLSDSDPIMVCNASTQANAQAIAALPDLVEALVKIIKYADSEPDGGETVEMHRANIERARQAIRKIEG